MKMPLKTLGLLLIGYLTLSGSQSMAATYTWSGASGGSWSAPANWTANSGVPTTSDTANLLDTATTRNVIYDTSASGVLGALSITQTSNAINKLTVQKNLTVANAITLAASSGTSMIYIDSYDAAAGLNLTVPSLTLNSGGVLAFSVGGASNTLNPKITGSVIISGGSLIEYLVPNTSSAGYSFIAGDLSMTSGTIWIGATGVSGLAGTQTRLQVSGNVNITGGAVKTASIGNFEFTGSTINISGLLATSSSIQTVVLYGAGNQVFTCESSPTNAYLTSLQCRSGTNVTRTIGAPTTSGTLAIGNLSLTEDNANQTMKIVLSSDVLSGSFNASNAKSNSVFTVDLNGHTFFTSGALGFTVTSTTGTWNFVNGKSGGLIAAQYFDFSGAPVTNIGLNSNYQIILTATTAGANNNLSGTGTIAANTLFSYVGSGTAYLTASNRAIGQLSVGNGSTASVLNLAGGGMAALSVQGDVTVKTGAVLNLIDKALTQTNGLSTAGGLNGGGSIYNNGSSGGTSLITLNTYWADGLFSGVIGDATGTGKGKVAVTLTGGFGKQTFTGTNTYSGATTIGAGNTLELGNGTSDGVISSQSAIVNNGELDYNIAGTQTYGGVISGGGVVSMVGPGTQILSGNNTYTGQTSIVSGTLQIGAGGTTGVLAPSSAISNNGALVFNRSDVVTQGADFANTISGSGSVTQAGSGKLILGGNNTYTGATIVASGEMDINGSIADASAVTVKSGATLGGSGTANGTLNVQDGGVNGNGLHLGAATFDGQSTLSGTTTAASFTVNSGTTTASGVHTTSGNLAVNVGSTLKNTGSFSANIVSVANTATLTNNGTLNGTVNVSGLLNGTGTINGALTIKTNGELAPGNSPGITTVAGNLTVETGAKISMQIDGITAAGTDYDQIVVTGATSLISLNAGSILSLSITDGAFTSGALTLIENQSDNAIVGTFSSVVIGGNTYDVSTTNKFTYGGKEYELLYNVDAGGDSKANDLQLTVVPEPGTWAMLLGGLGMLLGAQRMRRRSA